MLPDFMIKIIDTFKILLLSIQKFDSILCGCAFKKIPIGIIDICLVIIHVTNRRELSKRGRIIPSIIVHKRMKCRFYEKYSHVITL